MKAKDIAKKLGISTATVSLALNDRPGVNIHTRAKILAEAEQSGLILQRQAERRKTILFIEYRKNGQGSNQDFFSQIFSDVIKGVEHQARNKFCSLSMLTTDRDNFQEQLDLVSSSKVSGLIILGTELCEEQIKLLEKVTSPIVLLDNYSEDSNINCITINNEQTVELAIRHLVANGHSEIGYFHVEGDALNFKERYFAFKRSLELHNIKLEERNIIRFTTLFGGEAVYREIKKSLEAMEFFPTAFLADNDISAIYAIKALKELKIRVPQDVSVVSVDNIIAGEFIDPPLTSISTSKFELGCAAVDQLINLISGQLRGVQKIEIKSELIKRKSVKKILV